MSGPPKLHLVLQLRGLLARRAAVQDERRQRHTARQLLHVAGELQGLELCDLGELLRLGRGDDGDPLGNLEGLLQLLGALGAEEVVDGALRLLQVAADHAEACHVQDHGDAEGHQAGDNKVQAQAAVGVRHTQRDAEVPAGGDAGVAAAVLEGDRPNAEAAVLPDVPLLTCRRHSTIKSLSQAVFTQAATMER